jgi:hypothetical protein
MTADIPSARRAGPLTVTAPPFRPLYGVRRTAPKRGPVARHTTSQGRCAG